MCKCTVCSRAAAAAAAEQQKRRSGAKNRGLQAGQGWALWPRALKSPLPNGITALGGTAQRSTAGAWEPQALGGACRSCFVA